MHLLFINQDFYKDSKISNNRNNLSKSIKANFPNGQTFTVEADELTSVRIIGKGEFGEVSEMIHKKTGTIFAVKVIVFTSFK